MPKLTDTQTIVNARRDPPDAAQRFDAEQAALTDPDRIA